MRLTTTIGLDKLLPASDPAATCIAGMGFVDKKSEGIYSYIHY